MCIILKSKLFKLRGLTIDFSTSPDFWTNPEILEPVGTLAAGADAADLDAHSFTPPARSAVAEASKAQFCDVNIKNLE